MTIELSRAARSVFLALASGRSAHFNSLVRACEEAGVAPSLQDDKYVFRYNMQTLEVVADAEWVGGDRWERFAEGILGRSGTITSDEQALSALTMSPAR